MPCSLSVIKETINAEIRKRTLTEIRLVTGDVRRARERFVVVGRDLTLREYYRRLTGNPFSCLSGVMREFPVLISQADDRSLTVLATSYRPSSSSRRQSQQIRNIQSAIEYPLAHFLSLRNASEIAMVPVSCRAPTVSR